MTLRRSLRLQLNAVFVLIVVTMTAVLGTSTYLRDRTEQFALLDAQAKSALGRLSTTLPTALWDMDDTRVNRLIGAEMDSPALVGILVVNGPKVIAGLARDEAGTTHPVVKSPVSDATLGADIVYENDGKKQVIGRVEVHLSRAEALASIRRHLVEQSMIMGGTGIAMLALMSFAFSRLLMRPLDQLRVALQEVGSGNADLSQRMPAGKSSEFQSISDGFNRFVDRLSELVVDVRQRSRIVASGTEEISMGNNDLSRRTEEQATIVQQSAQAVGQLTQIVAEHASSADEAQRVARTASELAAQGGVVMVDVVRVIGDISQSSRRITDIINVIDGISFQTNILALNAAVEAARAGEQGRGFAVVASEVRALASRSASAAKEIKALITDSVAKVEIGQKQVQEGGTTISAVVAAVQRVNSLVDEMAVASSRQHQELGRINGAMGRIDQTAQQNAALVEEVTAAASSVRESMHGLVESMSAFKLADG